MAKLATGTVLYPAKDNKESQHNPGQRPIKWKLDNGEDARTWHYPSEDAYHLPKGTKAQLVDTGKGWSIVEGTADQQPQRQDAPAPSSSTTPSTGTGYTPAPADQPLDRVGEPGREEALNEELTIRLKLMHRTIQAVTKSLAIATGNWEPLDEYGQPDPNARNGRVVNPELLDQTAIQALANSWGAMSLFDQRTFFGGGANE